MQQALEDELSEFLGRRRFRRVVDRVYDGDCSASLAQNAGTYWRMPTALVWIALGALFAEVLTVSAVQPWRRDENGPVVGLAVGGAGLAVWAAIAAALPDPIPLVVWWSLLAGVALMTSMAAIGSALVLVRYAGETYRDLWRRPVPIGASCGLIGASALVVIATVAAPLLSELPSLAVTASAFLLAHVLWLAGYMLSSAREVR